MKSVVEQARARRLVPQGGVFFVGVTVFMVKSLDLYHELESAASKSIGKSTGSLDA